MTLLDILTPVAEIGVIAIILNYLLSFFWNTRSMDLLIGLLAFFAIFAMSSVFHFPILYSIMSNLMSVAAVGLMIIFQPELRTALSKLSLKGKRYREVTEFDKFLDQLASSVYTLAAKECGALIALEYMDKLDEFTQKAVMLNAQFSSELLESIFGKDSPLHDGAVIIRGMTILAASAIFPLADESVEGVRCMRTRHLAALGMSQKSDALIIVISEQSGKVSLVRKGIFSTGIKLNQFKGVVRSIYRSENSKTASRKMPLRDWMGA